MGEAGRRRCAPATLPFGCDLVCHAAPGRVAATRRVPGIGPGRRGCGGQLGTFGAVGQASGGYSRESAAAASDPRQEKKRFGARRLPAVGVGM